MWISFARVSAVLVVAVLCLGGGSCDRRTDTAEVNEEPKVIDNPFFGFKLGECLDDLRMQHEVPESLGFPPPDDNGVELISFKVDSDVIKDHFHGPLVTLQALNGQVFLISADLSDNSEMNYEAILDTIRTKYTVMEDRSEDTAIAKRALVEGSLLEGLDSLHSFRIMVDGEEVGVSVYLSNTSDEFGNGDCITVSYYYVRIWNVLQDIYREEKARQIRDQL